MSHHIMAHQDMADSTTGPPWVEATAGGEGAIDRPHYPHTPPSFPSVPFGAASGGPSIEIGRYLFAPIPTIPDPEMALTFFARLLAESPGSYIYVMALGAWMERFWPFSIQEARSPGCALGAYFSRVDEFACELRRLTRLQVPLYICSNPTNSPADRGSINRFVQLKHGGGAGIADIAVLRWVIIDIDPVNRRHGENGRHCQHEAPLALARDVLSGEPEIARSSYRGSSGNGAHVLVRLPDLPNNRRNRALVAGFVRALAKKYPATVVPIPDDEVASSPEPDRYTGALIDENTNVAKVLGLPGSVKCKGPHSDYRPRRVVTLAGLDLPIEPFDIRMWMAANGASVEDWESEGDDEADDATTDVIGPPSSKASMRRKAGACREWLATQLPAVEGSGGDLHTFEICRQVMYRCWGMSTDQLLVVLEDWNGRCEPPWDEDALRRKIDLARPTVRPPPRVDPLAHFDPSRFFAPDDQEGGANDG